MSPVVHSSSSFGCCPQSIGFFRFFVDLRDLSRGVMSSKLKVQCSKSDSPHPSPLPEGEGTRCSESFGGNHGFRVSCLPSKRAWIPASDVNIFYSGDTIPASRGFGARIMSPLHAVLPLVKHFSTEMQIFEGNNVFLYFRAK